ncbi:MAG: hypothetical protein K0S11_296 [Gammaproteobacteria bacterium]|jgi:DNA-binding phage protein|nr:hypothetical protein [Gammaproteobacteria bacterium]
MHVEANHSSILFYVNDLLARGDNIATLAKNSGLNKTSLERLLKRKQRCLSNKNFLKLISYWCRRQLGYQ